MFQNPTYPQKNNKCCFALFWDFFAVFCFYLFGYHFTFDFMKTF